VREGEALVIGGYYNETRRLTDSGVPGLKNIPLLGALFRNREKVNDKTERLFVLSPRIIHPGQSPLLEGTEAERAFTHSPAKEALDQPVAPDAITPVKNRPLWRRSGRADGRQAPPPAGQP
ncbi:MAG: type II and III secretion system protein, partial [Planctomycetota bacterium]|jgi:type II secretory pathway component GspD/PulD (secretin)|nr:type II and III secretion system protein [Planctomycetota bacterium]